MRSNNKTIQWMFFAVLLILAGFISGQRFQTITDNAMDTGNADISENGITDPEIFESIPSSPAFDLVKEMKIGWNLGNTLDSCDFKKKGILTELADISPEQYYETLWGNPVAAKETIEAVADAGFGVVRIPVTYYDHMDEQFKISEGWLRRIEEVVGYVIYNNMYCIINLHHDAGENTWLKADPEYLESYATGLNSVWLQISEFFKDYDNRLIFEGFNEILDKKNNWTKSSPEAYEAVNHLNQVFVDTVRSTQGNNSDRFLIVNTYAAGIAHDMLDAFEVPKDSVEGHLIVGVHSYTPQEFTWHQENVPWTNTFSNWDAQKCEKPLEQIFKLLNTRFIENDIPVIVSEFAAWNKSNTMDRAEYAAYFVSASKKYHIIGLWWDDGGYFESADEVNTSALLDRRTNEWFFPEIVQAMVQTAKG